MNMCELTMQERDMLDELNEINLKLVKNESQSLWNVCWGYLQKKFDDKILNKSDKEIKDILKSVNEQAPKIAAEDDLEASVDEMYTSVAMSPLF